VEIIWGFKPEERLGASGFELVHPDDKKFLAEAFNALVQDTNSTFIQSEMRLRSCHPSSAAFYKINSLYLYL
jgi:hypothetical protein